ncbi:hypothetical protein CIP107569_01827 [Corynebacterium diphtheriae]|nr:hypothetical protein BT092_08090 [Corynebacterium diphtheriae]CAB0516675.1 hypothetical protein FRC061569_01591 [Corynebacterium diphtheriae]CAB0520049.1 hypothetical protein FRC020322_01832 [Corynebacterium diphtheriae]CAB0520717.1 hypothetical protein FRC020338_01826 [Corynebacterium diphtheriae]CAB0520840.1 hypothetical protein FRC031641_01831 [Corynebacterium diphtheriae]
MTLNQAAYIQKDSRYPLDTIRAFHRIEEYEIFKRAGLEPRTINGRTALVRKNTDWAFKDKNGLTNPERARKGIAPLDPSTNIAFELHHIGQTNDASLAILTVQEHRSSETMKILHKDLKSSEVEHGREWLLRKHAALITAATLCIPYYLVYLYYLYCLNTSTTACSRRYSRMYGSSKST